MKRWYVVIGIYLAMHIAIMTRYTPMPVRTENDLASWLFALQWFVPTAMLGLLVPRIQRLLDRVDSLRVCTITGFVIIGACVTLYFTSALGRWFAWSTLGLLVLLMLTVANSQTKLKGTDTWLLGAMVVLLAMGSWEMLYQTGLLFYYDFFGCGVMSYYVVMGEQLTWIIPASIVVLVMYRRGLRVHIGRIAIVCLGASMLCTALWFVNGMDLPLLWYQGPTGLEGPIVNEAARPLMISISRGSQGFWLLGIVALFLGSRRRFPKPYLHMTEQAFLEEAERRNR